MSKEAIKAKEQHLIAITTEFCKKELNSEYAKLCEKLIKKLGRKRDVPFQRGDLDIWAASILHAIGTINFLFDKNNEPYIPVQVIMEYFGANTSTVGQKSKKIRDTLKLNYFDKDFSTGFVKESNPLNNFVMIDGLIMPMDTLPEDLQKEVKEARAIGEDIEFFTK